MKICNCQIIHDEIICVVFTYGRTSERLVGLSECVAIK